MNQTLQMQKPKRRFTRGCYRYIVFFCELKCPVVKSVVSLSGQIDNYSSKYNI